MSNRELRRQAERLLVLALQARERGNLELADQLIARAMRFFDEANGIANIPESPPTAQPSTPVVPQQQQQQQKQQHQQQQQHIQPKEDSEEE
jgi:hypothetical protein